MFSKFLSHINKQKYFDLQDRIIIAVSGGIDSMVLLDLMRKTEYQINVAYFDHLTRSGQSSIDGQFVKNYCEKHDIPYFEGKMDNSQPYKNFHEEAHIQRYRFLQSLNPDKLVTAHHQDDHTESILLNFFRGFSTYGINDNHHNIVRPLLVYSKKDITEYASKNNIQYRTDITNALDTYDRNFIRQKILPVLTERIPNLPERVQNISLRINNLENAFTSNIEQLIKPQLNDDYISLNKDILSSLNAVETVLFQYLKKWQFSMDQASNIIRSLNSTGATFESKYKTLIVDRNELRIYDKTNSDTPTKMTIAVSEGFFLWANWKVYMSLIDTDVDKITFSKSKLIEYFDAAKVGDVITVRQWNNGDYFHPINMNGQKQTLKKFFANQKLDIIQKHKIPVFTTVSEDIFYVGTVRADERFKVTHTTQKLLKIEFVH